MSELKPCPFCGMPPAKSTVWVQYDLQCENEDCPVQPGLAKLAKTQEQAIAWWNARADQVRDHSTEQGE